MQIPVPLRLLIPNFWKWSFGHVHLYTFLKFIKSTHACGKKKNHIKIFVMHKIPSVLLLLNLQALWGHPPEALNQFVFLVTVNTFTPPINVFILLS